MQKGHVILNAPPGSGKSTLVPLLQKDANWLADKKIVMLEPRRIAARACALRMASLLGETVGQTVGYQTRFEKKLTAATRIEVITEGLLTRRLQNDPELSDTGLLIFDEFHERNLQGDLALALALDTVTSLRDDLRILVMSATLNSEKLKSLLQDASEIDCKGSMYPVDISYLKTAISKPLAQVVRGAVHRQIDTNSGDILVFLPSTALIKQLADILAIELPDILTIPLFGDLSPQDQDRALLSDPSGKRKIVLATDIAETSLTIEGTRIVIDSGLARKPSFNPNTGLTALETIQISKSSATQRAGRAGRLAAGSCLRLWTEREHAARKAFAPAEILGADLSSFCLELLQWGVTDPDELQWVDQPPRGHWQQGLALLQQLTAIDEKYRLTSVGKKLSKLPLHPRLAYLIIHASEVGCAQTGVQLAALLSERDIFDRDRSITSGADILDRLTVISIKSRQQGIHQATLYRVRQSIKQYTRMLRTENKTANTCDAAVLIAIIFPDRIAKRRQGRCYQLANGQHACLHENDPLVSSDYLVIANLDAGKREGRIYSAIAIDKATIVSSLGQLVTRVELLQWNEKNQKLEAITKTAIGVITLSETRCKPEHKEEIAAFWKTYILQNGLSCLAFSATVTRLLTRLQCIKRWQPEVQWPDVSESHLLATLDEWLLPWVGNAVNLRQIQKIDFLSLFLQPLGWEKQQLLKELLPSNFTVPSGSSIKLEYSTSDNPILRVRLQELFGLMITPTVCNGAVPVTIHILSPARRPVQVTADLESFWKNTYPEVKRDLKGRYPKHYWPDNPYQAEAIKGLKRKPSK